jgi:XTP/dITP diphosphohydrolase
MRKEMAKPTRTSIGRIVLATRNRHKLDEIRWILNLPGIDFVTCEDFPGLPDVAEDGLTFSQNAVKKAATIAKATGLWALGDDSGLEVAALRGAPGVNSARYAGKHGDDAANMAKLLKDMEGVPDRAARFRCVIALASPSGHAQTVEGKVEGTIGLEPRGRNGFGYDPVFIPHGYTYSYAQITMVEKNALSHRARALGAARWAWADVFATLPPEWPASRD